MRQRKAGEGRSGAAPGLRVRCGFGGMAEMTMTRIWRTVRAWGVAAALLGGLALPVAADLAVDLARISVEAAGGVQAHRELRAFKVDGTTRIEDHEVIFILYAARPRSVRIETLGESGSLVRAFDGVRAPWAKDGLTEPPRRLGAAEEQEFMLEADFDSPLFDSQARNISLDYAGQVTVDGRVYHTLLATMRFTDVSTLYLDEQTSLLTRRDVKRRLGGKVVTVETHYGDHRPVAGVLMPHHIRTVVQGRVMNETVLREYVPNPLLAPEFFAPPVAGWPRP